MARKAQSGLEYLITYAWAFLVIILVVSALLALNVFSARSWVGEYASGFGSFIVTSWSFKEGGVFSFELNNPLDSRINITNITVNDGSVERSTGLGFILGSGAKNIFSVGQLTNMTAGDLYSVTVKIYYTKENFAKYDSGVIGGKIAKNT